MEDWTDYVDDRPYTPVIMNDKEEGYYNHLYHDKKYSRLLIIVAIIIITLLLFNFIIV